MDLHTAQRLLVFGGTFDPPTVAHVVLPRAAQRAVGADLLVYVPAAQQPLKDRVPTPAEHRLAMLRLALEGETGVAVLTDELDRAGVSYTVDTLESLRRRVSPTAELRLLIGADNLRVFDRWRDWRRVVELAEPVVMVRPPDTRAGVLANLPEGFDAGEWLRRLIELPVMDVSSTEVRARVSRGEPITGLVPAEVERYIAGHALYGRGVR